MNIINNANPNILDDDDKSMRSESERGQQDHEMNKHQFTKLIDEKMKSEQDSAIRRQENHREKTLELIKDDSALQPMKIKRASSYISKGSSSSARMRDQTLDHPKAMKKSKHPIIRICLTGGPCAGKTTALATLNQVLT